MKMAQGGAAGTPLPTRMTWRARIRAGWRGLSTAERIAWIIAAAAIIFGIEIGGFFAITSDDKGFVYIINRFTGSVTFCAPGGCKDL
jgi:hypothetical protein